METRWSARGDAVEAVHDRFENIIHALGTLTEDEDNLHTRTGAADLLDGVQTSSFTS